MMDEDQLISGRSVSLHPITFPSYGRKSKIPRKQ
jgi:hypothetical protein